MWIALFLNDLQMGTEALLFGIIGSLGKHAQNSVKLLFQADLYYHVIAKKNQNVGIAKTPGIKRAKTYFQKSCGRFHG